MGPKKNPKSDGKKIEVIIGGKNVAALTDEQLVAFKEDYVGKLHEFEKENALLEVELNMLRNAWKTTEDKAEEYQSSVQVSEIELENVIIRRELDLARERMDPSQWQNLESEYDKRAMFDAIKKRIRELDEGPEDVIHLCSNPVTPVKDPEEMYLPKPKDMEERYEADKKNIKADKRLKTKKAKFDAKVNELIQIQEEMEEALQDEKDKERLITTESSQVIAPKDVPALEPLGIKALEEIAHEDITISTGSESDKTEQSFIELPNIVDDALAGVPITKKRQQLDPLNQAVKNYNYLRERKWKRVDPRYDDSDSCNSKNIIDSDNDHIFDDFNPMMEEDVDDDVHYYQMRKWLEYDYETLVEEMRKRVDRRMQAINYVWTKDVKNIMCAQVAEAEKYDLNLRETVRDKIDKEARRTKRNEEHLKLLIQGLEEVRVKMIRERYATNMCIAKQQTEELNYLVQESYDRTINELKASTKFNFNLTQMFFMRSTENDISLVHELHSEQKRVEDHVKDMKIEVEEAKKELALMKGPLEEQERIAKWMETSIAALQKDMRSKKDQERTNAMLSKEIELLESESGILKIQNSTITGHLEHLRDTFDEISDFRKRYKNDNAFCRRLGQLTKLNEAKIVNLRRKLKKEHGVDRPHWGLIRSQVMKNVQRCKMKQWHDLLETKAFNELVTQFDLRAREHQMKSYTGIDKLAIPYRKTSANIITTFNEKKKVVFPLNPRRGLES